MKILLGITWKSAFLLVVSACLVMHADSASAKGIGYDENTEIAVKGIIRNARPQVFRGYQCFSLQTSTRIFKVLTMPSWLARRMNLKFKDGAKVRVIGSKFFDHGGSLCLLARSLKFLPNGRMIVFRDRNCKPLWYHTNTKIFSCIKGVPVKRTKTSAPKR